MKGNALAEASTDAAAILYQPDERPPAALTVGMGLQYALLSLTGIMVLPIITFRAAEVADPVLVWAVFASVAIGGLAITVQAFPVGRIGAGYILAVGPTSAAIAICVDALAAGGPGLLATLMLAAAAFQLLFAARLSMLRRAITPTVAGTVLILVPVTVIPAVFGMFDDVPAGQGAPGALAPGLITMAAMIGATLWAGPRLRSWSPVIGMVLGSVVAGLAGTYDTARLSNAHWIGLPEAQWPQLSLDFGPSFWSLFPAFLLVYVICTIRTISGTLAIQGVSWRRKRAVDFRSVQGAVAADAFSNALSGLAGTMPNSTRATTVSLTRLTGVGARPVGVVFGLGLVLMACSPKVLALVMAVPGPVIAGYLTVLMAAMFIVGIKMIVSDSSDLRLSFIAGLSFWVGIGCEYDFILPAQLDEFAGGLFGNGITTGGALAMGLTLLLEVTGRRRRRLDTGLDVEALEPLRRFVDTFAADNRWSGAMAERMGATCEETLVTLLDQAAGGKRRLRVTLHRERDAAVMEFVAAAGGANIEDRISLLDEQADVDSLEREAPIRLLRSFASKVVHRQYHEVDIVTVHVSQP